MLRRLLPLCFALATPLPVVAQGLVQAVPGTTDADRLAAQMRLLAVNANDLSALLAAGELSVKLDDLGAAASFFARADRIDPRNGRAKAGEGAILVHAERPGEALRYFAQAEGFGLAPAAFAADRGLAYDLIGEQERAQRDYRLALRTGPNEEAQRRYALSLAIAGKRELADQELQPLLRKSDRGAWRVHAFVLAMGGNVAEASRIATTMMPPGTAAGLQPFLEKLPTLTPVDRAFAVHFGEVRSTPQRVADARLTPALPALAADPYAPRVAVAAVASPVDKGKRRKDRKREAVQVAVATPAPEPLPQAPAYRGAPSVAAVRGTAPAAWPAATAPATRAPVAPAPTTLAAVSRPISVAPRTVDRAPSAAPAPAQVAPTVAASRPPVTSVAVKAAPPAPPPETNVVVAATATALPAASPTTASAVTADASTPRAVTPAPVLAAAPTATSADAPRPSLAAVEPAARPSAPAVGVTVVERPRRDNAALAGIVAGLPIPAAELGVVGPVRQAPAAATIAPTAEADRIAAERAARAAAAQALADKRAADRKAAAEKKALAEKKAAAAQKAEEAREAAAQKKLERANPERIWVQVSGGAYAGDLPKAWAAVKAKGGDLFAGHATGWTTPLRFTNRVLAGPFKSKEEARAFVNKLPTKGLSGFTFTSDAGQVVRKLDSE